MASTAIPGVFEPVEIDGDLHVDGMLTASVDLETAANMDATEILAIALEPPEKVVHPKTVYGVLKRSLGVLQASTTSAMEACLKPHLPLKVVRPDLSQRSPWRLDDSEEAIAKNLEVARQQLRSVLDARGHVIDQRQQADFAGQAARREAHALQRDTLSGNGFTPDIERHTG